MEALFRAWKPSSRSAFQKKKEEPAPSGEQYERVQLEHYPLGQPVGVDLYRQNDGTDTYVLIADKQKVLDEITRRNILKYTMGMVFKQKDKGPAPSETGVIRQIVSRSDLTTSAKVRVISTTAYTLCKEIFEKPLSSETFKRSNELLDAVCFMLDSATSSQTILSQIVNHNPTLFHKSVNAVFYATELARRLGLSIEDMRGLGIGMMLRDLGMLKMPKALIIRSGPMTQYMQALLWKHTQIGAQSLLQTDFDVNAYLPVVLYHHERMDGSGYPKGLKRGDIPATAQIAGLTDSFVAIASRNLAQGKERPGFEALKTLAQEVPTRFDRTFWEKFVPMFEGPPTSS